MRKRSFKVILSKNDTGGFTVTVPSLPGCITQGSNREEALEHAHEAIEGFLEALEKEGLPIPDSDVMIDEVQVRYGS
ncbi:MAG: type II toxin-antitoxin system HicB family antitoxin [Peptococcaceae bacterium]|jgi:predicted RNase H-like HicB family nuclease|nr:type II toxin-antitoxin system HicB family antitoxin [Peptococcaceae bacterium]